MDHRTATGGRWRTQRYDFRLIVDKSPFVLFGAGGIGRELLGWIACCSAVQRERFRIEAFISEWDDAGSLCHAIPVVRPDAYQGGRPRYLIAVADPAERKRIAGMLDAMGWVPETFVHDTAVVGIDASIGPGTIIFPYCRIATAARIGAHVIVNSGSGVAHDTVLGDFVTLLGSVSLNGHVAVGEGALFGAGSSIYPGRKVGAWCRIGMGSVVLRNVAEGTTVFGNPAQVVGGRKAR